MTQSKSKGKTQPVRKSKKEVPKKEVELKQPAPAELEKIVEEIKEQPKEEKAEIAAEEIPAPKEGEKITVEPEAAQELQEEIEVPQDYIYVYGIINKRGIEIDVKGLKDKQIERIDFEDVSALTSAYKNMNPLLNEEEVLQHADILKKIIVEGITIIPMSFGMVFKNKEILEGVLEKSYQAIKETLALIDGKIELGVKVVKNQTAPEDNTAAQEILDSLNKLSVKSVKGEIFSERLFLNYSFLVERNKFSEFSEEVAKLEGKYKELKFIFTGPWPPYSFVSIKIQGGGD